MDGAPPATDMMRPMRFCAHVRRARNTRHAATLAASGTAMTSAHPVNQALPAIAGKMPPSLPSTAPDGLCVMNSHDMQPAPWTNT